MFYEEVAYLGELIFFFYIIFCSAVAMACKDRGDVDKDGDSARVRILWSSSFSTALQKLI